MKNPRMEDIYGFDGDGRDMSPGATADSILNGLAEKYAEAGFEKGPAPDLKNMPQIEPAEEASSAGSICGIFFKSGAGPFSNPASAYFSANPFKILSAVAPGDMSLPSPSKP